MYILSVRFLTQEHGSLWLLLDVYEYGDKAGPDWEKSAAPRDYPVVFAHCPRKYAPDMAVTPTLGQFKQNMKFISGALAPELMLLRRESPRQHAGCCLCCCSTMKKDRSKVFMSPLLPHHSSASAHHLNRASPTLHPQPALLQAASSKVSTGATSSWLAELSAPR